MATRVSSIAIDCLDPAALGSWWAETLGWSLVVPPDPQDVLIAHPNADAWTPTLLFLASAERKVGKNRIHFDLASNDYGDRHRFAAHLLGRGAMPCDIAQGEVAWIVMADPEGNEFCVLNPQERHQVEPLDGTTVDAEADRLRGVGACDIDIGQHDDPDTDWIVLVDPFGDEFCVVPAGS